MAKIFYNLPNDIIDKSAGYPTLIDMLQKSKYTIYTEPSQLRGEKIDIAYINYNEQLLTQISSMNIRKISIFSKGDDDIIIPRDYVKYSSDLMLSMNKTYNVIINNKNYKTDNEIIISGMDDVRQDILRNIYLIFGNVITSTMKKYDEKTVQCYVYSKNIPNSDNIYYTAYTTLEGLKRCIIQKNVIKLRSNEYYTDLSKIIKNIHDDKIITNNLGWLKTSTMKYQIGEHIIAGRYEIIKNMYTNIVNILNNKITDLRKKLRLEYTPEQITAMGALLNDIYFFGAKEDKYAREILQQKFIIIPIEEMGYYIIQCGNEILNPTMKDVYAKTCVVKNISDI